MNSLFTTLLRAIKRDIAYTSINLTGLALGLAFSFLIFLWLRVELSYDSQYDKSDQIYRIGASYLIGGNLDEFCNLARPVGPTLKQEYPELLQQTRVAGYNGLYDHKAFFRFEQRSVQSNHVFYADSTFFRVFQRNFIGGSSPDPLTAPRSVVLSESLAMRLFGDIDPIGQQVKLDGDTPVQVTAVFEDFPLHMKTHLPYEAVLSWDLGARPGEENVWIGWHTYTYGLFNEAFSPIDFKEKFGEFKAKYMQKTMDNYGAEIELILQPMTSIHLDSDLTWEAYQNGSRNTVYLFLILGLFLLLIAMINYVNLATARSAVRAKEVGVKKVMGCGKGALRMQFLGESMLMAMVTGCIGWIIAFFLLPSANELTGQEIPVSFLWNAFVLISYFGLVLFVGLLAGLYPAYVLSAMDTREILRSKFSNSGRGIWLRKSLVAFQFSISIALVVGTTLVIRQLTFIQNKDLGFNEQNVMVAEIGNDPSLEKVESFLAQLLTHPHIQAATHSHNVPGIELNQTLFDIPDAAGVYNSTGGQFLETDERFFQVLEMKLVVGRTFIKGSEQDRLGSIMLNEAAARQYGWDDDALGKKLGNGTDSLGNRILYEVVGVIGDFHVGSLHNAVQPIVMFYNPDPGNHLLVKMSQEDIRETMAFVREQWNQFDPSSPLNYTFLDENFQTLYRGEQKLLSLLVYISVLIMVINALGLLGLLAYAIGQKKREISIRRVLGSTLLQIQSLLMKDYVFTLGFGLAAGGLASWYFMSDWLDRFYYRVQWQGWEFVLATGVVAFLSLVVLAITSSKTLKQNPSDVLRND